MNTGNEKCREKCTCGESVITKTRFFQCSWGFCQGVKCAKCWRWIESQDAHCCYPKERGNCSVCVKERCGNQPTNNFQEKVSK
jgi:hypothetical protein